MKLKGILLFHCQEPGQPMSPGGELADVVLIGKPVPSSSRRLLPISYSTFIAFMPIAAVFRRGARERLTE